MRKRFGWPFLRLNQTSFFVRLEKLNAELEYFVGSFRSTWRNERALRKVPSAQETRLGQLIGIAEVRLQKVQAVLDNLRTQAAAEFDSRDITGKEVKVNPAFPPVVV